MARARRTQAPAYNTLVQAGSPHRRARSQVGNIAVQDDRDAVRTRGQVDSIVAPVGRCSCLEPDSGNNSQRNRRCGPGWLLNQTELPLQLSVPLRALVQRTRARRNINPFAIANTPEDSDVAPSSRHRWHATWDGVRGRPQQIDLRKLPVRKHAREDSNLHPLVSKFCGQRPKPCSFSVYIFHRLHEFHRFTRDWYEFGTESRWPVWGRLVVELESCRRHAIHPFI